jgi:hypothetical protein
LSRNRPKRYQESGCDFVREHSRIICE